MSDMENALQSASKYYSNKWVCDDVPDAVIENNDLYYTFIAVVKTDLTNLWDYLTNTLLMR